MNSLLNFSHPTLAPERSQSLTEAAIAQASDTLLGPPKPTDREPLDFKTFVQESWPILEPGREFQDNWSVDAIVDHLSAVVHGDIKRLVINVPPGSMKSLLTCVMFPAWAWGEVDPSLRWLFSSYASALAVRDSTKCRRLIKSPWYQARYGHVFQILKDEDTKTKFENNKTGFRQCTSPKGTGTGNRADMVVCLPYNELISTDVGLLKIGEIVEKRLTPMVKGFDHETGEEVWAKILNHEKNPFRPFIKIKTAQHQVELTDDHEVYVIGKGYVCAASVVVGDLVVYEDASKTKLTKLRRVWQRVLKQQNSLLHLSVLQRQQKGCGDDNLPVLWETILSLSKTYPAIAETILLKHMLWERPLWDKKFTISGWENSNNLSNLQSNIFRGSRSSKSSEDVFNEMLRDSSENTSTGESNLPILSRTFCCQKINQASILLSQLRQQRPFAQDDWRGEQQLFSRGVRGEAGEAAFKSARQGTSGQGQGDLSALRNGRSRARFETTFPPHQLHQRRRQNGEHDYALSVLSREDAWQNCPNVLATETVQSVERSQRIESHTYNIATATGNYFAGGLLLHNCDDPIKVSEGTSEKKRQAAVDWWNTEMSNRGSDRNARFVVIMQRIHEFDVAGSCLEQGYELLKIPQEFEPDNTVVSCLGWKDPRTNDGELMWPERFDENFVESQQLQLGAYAYSGQHQQRPTPAEGGIIKREYLEERFDIDVPPEFEAIAVTVDTAEKPGVDNAYSVFQVFGVTRDKYYLMDVYRKKVDAPALKNDFYDLCAKWKPNFALIEDKSSGTGLIQYGKKETRINIIPIKPEGQKEIRLINESSSFHARKVVIPKQGQRPWVFDYVDELTSAPNGQFMDLCDATSQFLKYMRETWQPKTGAALLRGKK